MGMVDEPAPADDRDPIVVGMGASAGGLEALQRFFAHMPAEHDLAFVVVMHQAGRSSVLPGLLARHSPMTFVEAADGMAIASRRVYVAPPGSLVDISHRRLHVKRPARGAYSIDHFFRSLARDRGEQAIGIILSGTGTDGTLGVREIKAAHGMVMVQDEASARCSGMPESAIATAMVDHVLPVEECPGRLIDHVTSPPGGRGARSDGVDDATLASVVGLLGRHAGHDLSRYSPSAMQRGIGRRMRAHRIASPEAYIQLMDRTPAEVEALSQEVLVRVTSFFRDPDAFAALGTALDRMLAGRPPKRPVRVWIAGCATGEEAYSVAIALTESAARVGSAVRFQIFATDTDERAVRQARKGVFAEASAGSLSPERIDRFFVRRDGLRVKKEIRDLIVFAEHNLLAHPPFIRLDLVCCRNVLIYLEPAAQRDALAIFEYALQQPGGLLLLGSSESPGAPADGFERVEPGIGLFSRRARPDMRSNVAPVHLGPGPASRSGPRLTAERAGKVQSGVVNRLLLQELAPPCALVDRSGEILRLHGRTARFLDRPAVGRGANLMDMALPDLDAHVGAVIRKAIESGVSVHRGVLVRAAGGDIRVDVRARRVDAASRLHGTVLVTFEEVAPTGREAEETPDDLAEQMAEIRRDLELSRTEQAAAVTEVHSTNHRLRAANDALERANQELEMSGEELQSLNEEMHSLNVELQVRLDEVSRLGTDLVNLLNNTDVAVLFLDRELTVQRYTLQATKLFDLIPSDVGRPLAEIVSLIDYPPLLTEAAEVLRSLAHRKVAVRHRDGGWYVMRLAPYRSHGDGVKGVVATFLDVSTVYHLLDLEGGLAGALKRLPLIVLGQNRTLRILWGLAPALGMDPASLEGLLDRDLLPLAEADAISTMKRQVLDTGSPLHAEVVMTLPVLGRTTQDLWIEPIRDTRGEVTGVLSVALDVTESKRAELLLQELRAELDAARGTSRRSRRPQA